MAEIEGMTVVYSGGPVASNNGRVGIVLGTVRNGWADVQFDGDAASTKCAPDFLHPLHNSPARVAALDLLAALKDARSRLIDFTCAECECDNTHDANGTMCCLCEYTAAIAKAEGRP